MQIPTNNSRPKLFVYLRICPPRKSGSETMVSKNGVLSWWRGAGFTTIHSRGGPISGILDD